MEEGLSLVSEIRKTFALPGVDVRSYSPLALAYIGDDVYDVVVRTFVPFTTTVTPTRPSPVLSVILPLTVPLVWLIEVVSLLVGAA